MIGSFEHNLGWTDKGIVGKRQALLPIWVPMSGDSIENQLYSWLGEDLITLGRIECSWEQFVAEAGGDRWECVVDMGLSDSERQVVSAGTG